MSALDGATRLIDSSWKFMNGIRPGRHGDGVDQGERGNRVVVAIGGNAIAQPGGDAADQRTATVLAMEQVAILIEEGYEVILTHGNGPQVGSLVIQNELAAGSIPMVPLHVCVAQTQASIGLMMMLALEEALACKAIRRQPVTLLTRVVVSPEDPAWTRATKPIGGFLDAAENDRLVHDGAITTRTDDRGWRRVVPSPDPVEILEVGPIRSLLDAGCVPIVAGGGGIPGVKQGSSWNGADAVLDKDLTAALLARSLNADCLVIATDVPHVVVHYGEPNARSLNRVTVEELRSYADAGHFPAGSMGPKVEAAARFVEAAGRRSVITALTQICAAVNGTAGTIVEPGQVAA